MEANRAPERSINNEQTTEKMMKPIVTLRQLTSEEILKWTSKSTGSNEDGSNSTKVFQSRENLTSTQGLGRATRSRKLVSTMETSRAPVKTINNSPSTKKRKSDCLSIDNTNCKKRRLSKNTVIECLEIQNAAKEHDIESNEKQLPKNSASSTDTTVAVNHLVVGEVIWGKIRGWPHWPAKIIRFHGRLVEVEWFNDYRTTKLYKSQVFKFYPNYDIFAEKFATSVGLKTAATEALIYITSKL